MILYIVRHAWAGHHGDPEYPNDDLRPLTDKGRKRFKRQVDLLVERVLDPAHIATSPLVRCRQTADIIAELAPRRPLVTELDELAPGSDLDGLIQWTSKRASADVAWVGHAPDVGQLAAELIGNTSDGIDFAKGAVAAIFFEGDIARAAGVLRWLVTADVLGC